MCDFCGAIIKASNAILDYQRLWQCQDCIDPMPVQEWPNYIAQDRQIPGQEVSVEPADQFIGGGAWQTINQTWESIDEAWNLLSGTPETTEDDF